MSVVLPLFYADAFNREVEGLVPYEQFTAPLCSGLSYGNFSFQVTLLILGHAGFGFFG